MEPVLSAEWYTDPFCSWSFAAEGPIEKFRSHFGSKLSFTHRLLPLYEDIHVFLKKHGMAHQRDFAPRIQKVSQATGVFMSPEVWETERAPTSSKECCLFAKAALLADPVKGDLFLSKIRQSAFLDARNIGEHAVLFELALSLGIDKEKLEDILRSGQASNALTEDQEKAATEGVTVRPTLIMTNSGGDRVFIGGLRNPDLFILAGESLILEAS